jgi:integrase
MHEDTLALVPGTHRKVLVWIWYPQPDNRVPRASTCPRKYDRRPVAVAARRFQFGDATMAKIEGLWWHDLRATFCTRLALAGYEALTIMTLMGHKDLKTTMRYIRALQLQRQVRSQNFVHKLATQEKRPPLLAAVSI